MISALAAAVVCFSPRIVDGDTLVCSGQKTRLWGISAPESYHPTGPRSTSALRELTSRQWVACVRLDRDHYGRSVSVCATQWGDLGRDMVNQGHARDWRLFSHGYYSEK